MLEAPKAFHGQIQKTLDTSVTNESGGMRTSASITLFTIGEYPSLADLRGRKVIVVVLDEPVKPV